MHCGAGVKEGESRTVCVFDTMSRAVGQATNRVFVGLPLCRDSTLLANAKAVSMDVPISSILLHFFWPPLRPIFAPILTIPNRIHTNLVYKVLRPEIRRKLQAYDESRTKSHSKGGGNVPYDFLQWSIDDAKASSDPYFGKVDTLAGRVLLNNFTSIHTSSFAITHAILDLASSKQAYIDELRRRSRRSSRSTADSGTSARWRRCPSSTA